MKGRDRGRVEERGIVEGGGNEGVVAKEGEMVREGGTGGRWGDGMSVDL